MIDFFPTLVYVSGLIGIRRLGAGNPQLLQERIKYFFRYG